MEIFKYRGCYVYDFGDKLLLRYKNKEYTVRVSAYDKNDLMLRCLCKTVIIYNDTMEDLMEAIDFENC